MADACSLYTFQTWQVARLDMCPLSWLHFN